MIVWVVLEVVDYEGDSILGVFSTREEAEKYGRTKYASKYISSVNHRIEVEKTRVYKTAKGRLIYNKKNGRYTL